MGRAMADGALHPFVETAIDLPSGVTLSASLGTPEGAARGVIVFAHGSGSSRHSGRNRHVAGVLHSAGLGTLLLDLLTEAEDEEDRITGRHRFEVGMQVLRLGPAVASAKKRIHHVGLHRTWPEQ